MLIGLPAFILEAEDAKWRHAARAVQDGMRDGLEDMFSVGQGVRQQSIVGKNCGLILFRMIPIEEPGRLEGGNVGETKPQSEKRTNRSQFRANIGCQELTRVGR